VDSESSRWLTAKGFAATASSIVSAKSAPASNGSSQRAPTSSLPITSHTSGSRQYGSGSRRSRMKLSAFGAGIKRVDVRSILWGGH
jgi:hypothetical protein